MLTILEICIQGYDQDLEGVSESNTTWETGILTGNFMSENY